MELDFLEKAAEKDKTTQRRPLIAEYVPLLDRSLDPPGLDDTEQTRLRELLDLLNYTSSQCKEHQNVRRTYRELTRKASLIPTLQIEYRKASITARELQEESIRVQQAERVAEQRRILLSNQYNAALRYDADLGALCGQWSELLGPKPEPPPVDMSKMPPLPPRNTNTGPGMRDLRINPVCTMTQDGQDIPKPRRVRL